jgi:hypothetical protein
MPAQYKREDDLAYWRKRETEERVMATDGTDAAWLAHHNMADGYAALASRSALDLEQGCAEIPA